MAWYRTLIFLPLCSLDSGYDQRDAAQEHLSPPKAAWRSPRMWPSAAASSPAAGAMSSYFAHEHAAQVAADALAAASSCVDYGSNCETRNLIHRLLRKMQSKLHRLLLGLHVPEPRLWNSKFDPKSSQNLGFEHIVGPVSQTEVGTVMLQPP